MVWWLSKEEEEKLFKFEKEYAEKYKTYEIYGISENEKSENE